jgi:serine/threonine-protein kinase RsbW
MADRVTLTFSAHTRNAALARTVAAAMAARADLPLDQLEDVRLAVDEAVSQLILDAPELCDIACDFAVDGPRLRVRVSAPSRSGQVPDRDTFSWTVLTALVDEVSATVVGGVVTLDLRIVRQVPVGT